MHCKNNELPSNICFSLFIVNKTTHTVSSEMFTLKLFLIVVQHIHQYLMYVCSVKYFGTEKYFGNEKNLAGCRRSFAFLFIFIIVFAIQTCWLDYQRVSWLMGLVLDSCKALDRRAKGKQRLPGQSGSYYSVFPKYEWNKCMSA